MYRRAEIDSLAAGATAIAASVSAVVFAPWVEQLDLAGQALAIVIGSPGFYGVYILASFLLMRWRLRSLLGEWCYITFPDDDPDTGAPDPRVLRAGVSRFGFGLMRYKVEDGDLDYEVKLFSDGASLAAAADKGGGSDAAVGGAVSEAIRYDHVRNQINILYHAKYHTSDMPDRNGRLYLELEGPDRLTGRWVSDVDKRTLATGRMVAVRRDRFAALFERLTGAPLDSRDQTS